MESSPYDCSIQRAIFVFMSCHRLRSNKFRIQIFTIVIEYLDVHKSYIYLVDFKTCDIKILTFEKNSPNGNHGH